MRFVVLSIMVALLVFMSVQVWYFYERGRNAEQALKQVEESFAKTKRDYETLQKDYEYYQETANIEKELRGRFNYRAPDEKMIVIVPQ